MRLITQFYVKLSKVTYDKGGFIKSIDRMIQIEKLLLWFYQDYRLLAKEAFLFVSFDQYSG